MLDTPFTHTPIALPPLRTQRLILREIDEADRDEFIRMYRVSTDHFKPWFPSRPAEQSDDEYFDEQLTTAHTAHAAGTSLKRLAFRIADGRLVGSFNLNNIARRVYQNADAGWSVSADALGLGFAAEGVSALLDLAFAPPPHGLGLHRVQANIMPPNAASLRVAAKCGFRIEGLARRMLKINGQWQDHVVHAKLTEEHTLRLLPTPAPPVAFPST